MTTATVAKNLLQVFVHTLRLQAQDVISVDLRLKNGEQLPPFTAGSHIDLHLPNGMIRSYSLLNDCREQHRYVIGVLRDKASRGGSRSVHHDLRIGMELNISMPRNNFKLDESAAHTVLIAGGIGVTPMLCMARRLKQIDASFEMFYLARSKQSAAFLRELQSLQMPLYLHFDDEQGAPPNLEDLLSKREPNQDLHHYACGPSPMLAAFEQACANLGHANAHIERFAAIEVKAASDAKNSYQVELRKSNKFIAVEAGKTLLDSLLAAGIEVEHSCCEGVCGSCETRVLEGEIDHLDSVLSASEKASNKVMMVCVSGCKSNKLVLDI